MKTFNVLVVALVFACNASAADVLTEKLQRGLFEEEANHNLDAAIKEYQSVISQSEEQRKVMATALFRLGECYRKLGRTNEANAQYERVLRDFSEQEQLVKLSRELLPRSSAPLASPDTVTDPVAINLLREEIRVVEQSVQAKERSWATGRGFLSDVLSAKKEVLHLKRRLPENTAPSQQRALLQEQIGIVKQHLADFEKRATDRRAPGEELPIQRELLSLQRELAVVGDVAKSAVGNATAPTDEEEKEVRRIQAMIKDSPDLINARIGGIGGTETPLHRATSAGQSVVARFLLENKADVNARNSVNDMPLHLAASRGHKSMLELLLDHGADVNATAANGTPLHYAAGNGFRAVVEVLLARGAEVNAKTPYGQTPLHSAVGNGHKAVVELLLDKGADLNAATSDGWVALHMAAHAGNKPITELLVVRGARVDVTRNDGQTPLNLATVLKSSPVVEVLLAKKADPNIPDKTGTTPLSYAVQKTSLELVNLLLARGADPNLGDRSAVTPLHWASIFSEVAMVEALLKNKAAPNPKLSWGTGVPTPTYKTPQSQSVIIPNGATPLWLAVDRGQTQIADLLLSFGAPVNERITVAAGGSTTYSTPLDKAVSNKDKNMVKLLLERKADPNVPVVSNDYLTPLMVATVYRSREIVELLLAHGAEVNVLANTVTPLSIVQNKWGDSPPSPELVELLLKHGAIEDLQRAASITVARGAAKYQVFQKGTNSLNRFSLFEALVQHYAPGKSLQNYFQFPDFARVKIRSLKSRAGDSENIVDLETAFQFTNCARNTWLEWGDLIELPEQDHVINVSWGGLSTQARNTLKECLRKQVQILVKGQTNLVVVTPELVEFAGAGVPMHFLPGSRAVSSFGAPGGIPGAATSPQSDPPIQIELTSQRLNDVIRAAKVIRSSSDLTRVNVKRTGGTASEQKEMIFDLIRLDKASDLWLRDGDVIEIPEKQ